MTNPIDPTLVRQGRLGRQVLVILVASMALAFVSGWILWGAVAGETDPEVRITEETSQAPRAPENRMSGVIIPSE